MQTLNRVPTADKYTDAATLIDPQAIQIGYTVANNPILLQTLDQRADVLEGAWGPEIYRAPESNVLLKCAGVRFRSAVAGQPAVIVVQSVGKEDSVPGPGVPFTGTLNPDGSVTPPATVSVLDTCRVLQNAPPQVLATGANPAVALAGSYEFNTNTAIFGTRAVTTGLFVQQSGIYLVCAYAVFQANAVGDRYISVRINGSPSDAFADVRAAAPALVTEILISDEVQLSAGQYIELYVYQASGGNLNLSASHLTMIKVQ